MSEITILVGVSCSGKSTWAKQQKNCYIVSRDIERTSLFGSAVMGTKKEEDAITKICHQKVLALIGGNIILDNTHLRASYIQDIYDAYGAFADIKVKVFEPPTLKEFIWRNNERFEKTGVLIPLHVFKKQLKQFEELEVPEFKQGGRGESWETENPEGIYIFDLDGTLADGNGRCFFEPKEGEVLNDKPIHNVVNIVKALPKRRVAFLSGRSAVYRDETEKWIKEHCKIASPRLYMRKKDDRRPDNIIKGELFDKFFKEDKVLGVFDDRNSVIEEWQKRGVYVFDCGQGNSYF